MSSTISKRNSSSNSALNGSSNGRTSLPLGWYVFFGIVEPISVLAGCVYATFYQSNYHNELIPKGYAQRAIAGIAVEGAKKSIWKAGTAAKTVISTSTGGQLDAASRMALAQLGSCYFLIMLNSALMFYAIRRWFSQQPVAQERVLYFLFTVLGLADWTHILFTIHFLPNPSGSSNALSAFASKLWILTTDIQAWNSLLFGNIVITFLLFVARAAWWVGLGRDRFFGGSVPAVPSDSKSR
jgi:hypothetical protein